MNSIFRGDSLQGHILADLRAAGTVDEKISRTINHLKFVSSEATKKALEALSYSWTQRVDSELINRLREGFQNGFLTKDYKESFLELVNSKSVSIEEMDNFILSFSSHQQLFETFGELYRDLANEGNVEKGKACSDVLINHILPRLEFLEETSLIQKIHWISMDIHFGGESHTESLKEEFFEYATEAKPLSHAVRLGDDQLFTFLYDYSNFSVNSLYWVAVETMKPVCELAKDNEAVAAALVKALTMETGLTLGYQLASQISLQSRAEALVTNNDNTNSEALKALFELATDT
jgi:hypothetical protein